MKKITVTEPKLQGIAALFKEWLDILGYSGSTVYYMPIFVREFLYWLEQHGINSIDHISLENVNDYYKYLNQRSHQRRSGGLSKGYLNKHQKRTEKVQGVPSKTWGKDLQDTSAVRGKETPKKKQVLTQSEIRELLWDNRP